MLPVPVPSKEITQDIEKGVRSFFGVVQRLLRLSDEQQKHAALIEKQAAGIKAQAAEIAALREALRSLYQPPATLTCSGQEERPSFLKKRSKKLLDIGTRASQRPKPNVVAASVSVEDLARRIGHFEARRSDDHDKPHRS